MKTTITQIKKAAFSKYAVIAFLGILLVFYAVKANAQTGVTKYGTGALANNSVTGNYNSAFGYYSLNLNTSGYYNSANGANGLRSNTTGYSNTAGGYGSLYKNTTGYYNTGYGAFSLYSDTTGSYNTAGGYASLYFTTGSYSTGYGAFSLYNNTTGSYNTGYGSHSLYGNTTGSANTANGYYSLYSNATGYRNTANGYNSLNSNTTGSYNTANGAYSLSGNTTGSYNTANGDGSLPLNTTGYSNVANGANSLNNNRTGYYNTANGYGSLLGTTSGHGNTGLGYSSLIQNSTGSNNTAVGYNASPTGGNFFNSTAIGSNAIVDSSNKVRIGNTSVTSIGGQVSWTTFSDGRYKKEIKENIPGLSFINSLRPVTYTVNVNGLNEYYTKRMKPLPENETNGKSDPETEKSISEASKTVYSGFIAQEVEAAAAKLDFTFSGVDKPQSKDGLYGLRYDNFVMPLVKAVQELSAENNDLKARLEKLEQMLSLNNAQQNSSTGNNTTVALTAASLEQNAPNPFNSSTVIRYRVPSSAGKAQVIVTNTTGTTVKAFTITTKGAGSVSINGGELSAGSYYYTLIIDGKKADSKQMILVK